MTLPTTNPLNSTDDDSDMFGPPRSSPVRLHQRPRVPMISAKLRQREERKRILQLCARKLERIKDSETNLRRSVCINNTYSRLTDEVRREKQSRYLANLPKSDFKLEKDESSDSYHMQTHSHFSNVVVSNYISSTSSSSSSTSVGLSNELRDDGHLLQIDHYNHQQHHPLGAKCLIDIKDNSTTSKLTCSTSQSSLIQHHQHHQLSIDGSTLDASGGGGVTTNATAHIGISTHRHQNNSNSNSNSNSTSNTNLLPNKKKRSSSCCVDTDLETLDRELSAINASMPLIDPEITQGAEQLEKAISSRKRARTEDENDRLVREALSQFYLPTQRLISAIDDCPLDIKRTKSCHHHHHHHHHHHSLLHHTSTLHQNPQNNLHCGGSLGVGMVGLSGTSDLDLDLGLDLNQNHKEFEVIMDALRLGTTTTVPQTVVPSTVVDSCGQAAMMSESGVFHNLVVTSLET